MRDFWEALPGDIQDKYRLEDAHSWHPTIVPKSNFSEVAAQPYRGEGITIGPDRRVYKDVGDAVKAFLKLHEERSKTAAVKPLVLDKARIAKWIENKTKRPVVDVFIHRGSSDYHIIAMTNHEDGPAKYEIEVKAVWESEGLALVPIIRGLRLATTNYRAFEEVRERVRERLRDPDLMGKYLRVLRTKN